MENLHSWLIIFSGATISFLGSFLFISERELKNKRREWDESRRKQAAAAPTNSEGLHSESNSTVELIAKNEQLAKEIAALASRLEESQSTLDEFQNQRRRLLSAESDNQQLHEKFDILKNRLEDSENRLSESTVKIKQMAAVKATLQAEIAELKQQLAQTENTIESLHGPVQGVEKLQSENQDLVVERQRLHEEIAELRGRLRINEDQLNETAVQRETLAERYAQLQTSVAGSKREKNEMTAKNKELLEEVAVLSSKLAAGKKTVEELRTIQHDARLENQRLLATNQQLQRGIADFHEQLETAQSQLGESAKHNQEATVYNGKLQSETAELKQQLEQGQTALNELQNVEQRYSEIQSESQKLRLENQRLQDEVENHWFHLNASETRLQELAHRNQEVSDRCAHLEAQIADLEQQLEDSQTKAREIEITPQQLANIESRELIYKEQQQKLEALIVDLERELSEGKNEFQALEDTHDRLRETDRVCQELANENRRLGEEISRWQERLAASEENQRQVGILRQQLGELQTEHARLIGAKRLGREEIVANGEAVAVSSCLASDSDGSMVLQSTTNIVAELSSNPGTSSAASVGEVTLSEVAISETRLLTNGSNETSGKQTDDGSADSAAEIHGAKEEEASRIDRTSVKRKWRFGAVPAIIIVIASIVAMGILGTRFLMSEESARPPETNSDEYTADPISLPQTKSAPRLRGTFETVRPTRVYGGPSENSPLIANIGPGMKLNVVSSSDGWLEIRSKHGRPPGFIRQESAVRIGQN